MLRSVLSLSSSSPSFSLLHKCNRPLSFFPSTRIPFLHSSSSSVASISHFKRSFHSNHITLFNQQANNSYKNNIINVTTPAATTVAAVTPVVFQSHSVGQQQYQHQYQHNNSNDNHQQQQQQQQSSSASSSSSSSPPLWSLRNIILVGLITTSSYYFLNSNTHADRMHQLMPEVFPDRLENEYKKMWEQKIKNELGISDNLSLTDRILYSSENFLSQTLRSFGITPPNEQNWLLWLIVGVNTVLYLYHSRRCTPQMIQDHWAVSYDNLFRSRRWYTLVTSTFAHGSGGHLLFNSVALVSLGSPVLNMIGPSDFAALYFAAAPITSLSQALVARFYNKAFRRQAQAMTALGASGCVCAIVGVFATLFPFHKLYVMLIPYGFYAERVVLFLFGLDFMCLMVKFIKGPTTPPALGHAAHMSGILTGYLYAKYILPQKQPRIKAIYEKNRIERKLKGEEWVQRWTK